MNSFLRKNVMVVAVYMTLPDCCMTLDLAGSFTDIRDFLVRFSSERPDDLSDLLPDEWLKTHPDARQRWSR